MPSSDIERDSFLNRIYNINEKDFATVAMEVWRYQYLHNDLYQSYCRLLGITPLSVHSVRDIPFLPINMFRDHEVKTGNWEAENVFRSSGTTAAKPSYHFIRDLHWYHQIARQAIERSFAPVQDFVWIGLLPSYLERTDSSLIDMIHHFMSIGKKMDSGFFPKVDNQIIEVLHKVSTENVKTIMIGVSFALLDLFENYNVPVWKNLKVIETGGMKGRGPELTREELVERMRRNHPTLKIFSEYGMTELLSQAYLTDEHFRPGPAMKVIIRDISDPMNIISYDQRGAINVIDLANIDTCSFIATDDIGISYEDGMFDVMGRLDESDIRGCNLLYT